MADRDPSGGISPLQGREDVNTTQFWFGGEHFVFDAFDWDEFEARWPDDVEPPNPAVAERIIRELAEEDDR